MCLIGLQKRMRKVKESRPVVAVRLFEGLKKSPRPVYRYDKYFHPTDWNMTSAPRADDSVDFRPGYWAFAPTNGWRKRVKDIAEDATLVGVVELKGRVAVHRYGYRAEELRILRLWQNPGYARTLDAVARFLVKAKKR